MELDKEKQKQTFLSICRENIHRNGLEDLLGWLQKADFFEAPASTRYHGAYAGGLCQHSIDVWEQVQKLNTTFDLKLSAENMAVSALFHDLCKVNFYKQDWKNQKIDGNWEQVPFYTIEEKFAYGGHGSKSVFLVERFMRLECDEAVAINSHMGGSEGGDSVRNSSNAYQNCKLAWAIHAADEAATFLLDR